MARAATDKRHQLYRSETATNTPLAADLARGELAVNLVDRTLFTKDHTDNVIELNAAPAVVNDLVTGGTTTALSADQGVALLGLINGLGSLHSAATIAARDALVVAGTVEDLDLVHVDDDGDGKWARYQRVAGGWVKVSDEDALAAGLGATNLGVTTAPTGTTVTNTSGSDAVLPLADATNAGQMSPADKTKLDAYPTNPIDTWIELTDTPAAVTANQFVMGNAAGNALEFVASIDGGTF